MHLGPLKTVIQPHTYNHLGNVACKLSSPSRKHTSHLQQQHLPPKQVACKPLENLKPNCQLYQTNVLHTCAHDLFKHPDRVRDAGMHEREGKICAAFLHARVQTQIVTRSYEEHLIHTYEVLM